MNDIQYSEWFAGLDFVWHLIIIGISVIGTIWITRWIYYRFIKEYPVDYDDAVESHFGCSREAWYGSMGAKYVGDKEKKG